MPRCEFLAHKADVVHAIICAWTLTSADITSNTYYDWAIQRAFLIVPSG